MPYTYPIVVDPLHLVDDRSHSTLTTRTMELLDLIRDMDTQSFPPTVPSCLIVLVSSQPSCNPLR
jgi:hypothetical protein